MQKNNNCIAKGIYSHSQLNDFVSVREYIFLKHSDKKCLIFRFCNETALTLDSIEFLLIELNSSGNVINKTHVVYDGLDINPDDIFSSKNGLVVSKECVDFKIQFLSVSSGDYIYRVKRGKVYAHYDKRGVITAKRKTLRYGYVESKSHSLSCGRICGFFAVLSLIFSIGICSFMLFRTEKDNKKPITTAAYYQEVTETFESWA